MSLINLKAISKDTLGYNLVNKHTSTDGVVDDAFYTALIIDNFYTKYTADAIEADDLHTTPISFVDDSDSISEMDDRVWEIFDNSVFYCLEDIHKRIKDVITSTSGYGMCNSYLMQSNYTVSYPSQHIDQMLNLGNLFLDAQWKALHTSLGFKVVKDRKLTLLKQSEFKYYATIALLLSAVDATNQYLKPLLGYDLVTMYADEYSPFFSLVITAKKYNRLLQLLQQGKFISYIASPIHFPSYASYMHALDAINVQVKGVIKSVQAMYNDHSSVVYSYVYSICDGLTTMVGISNVISNVHWILLGECSSHVNKKD